ncbi:Multi antimicrobial extrusion protein (Na(+)/drug antiporter), MATE family of MDR efflux pumps [Janthinobacterium sp. CG23_2]|nr:Multi antimicrobial extrusion protein (Na(+)/drug antiporter), MATE family of MDR efflux pumps [Janthinobacterium sp. CG23_2]CUU26805.1 Multi antimicrobial extrusion protein (Na(+)/drug antiporter), MATE family of MDR efflux pumps [Janthinobacterium sp. CG23_2]
MSSNHINKVRQASLFAMTWPIFVEQLSHILPGIVDTFMVSHLGDSAVAGLAVANQIVGFCVILFSFVGIGSAVVLTHYLGAGDHAGARRVAATAVGINFWLGMVVSVAIWAFSADMLRLLHLPPQLMPYAQPFLALMGGTLFLESINIAFGSVLRAHGHTREAMFVAIGMNVLNLILNVVLIFGLLGAPKMGVIGAALSTVISRTAACVALAWLVRRQLKLGVRLSWLLNLSRETLARILKIGLPAAGENLCWQASFMVITYFVGQMGVVQLATFSYAIQLSMIMMMLGISIGISTEIMIGHMIGAGEFDQAYRQLLRSLRVGLGVTVVTTCVVVLLAPWLLGFFSKDPAIVAGGAVLLRISLLLEPGRTFNLVVINSLRATGDARFPVLMGACSMWGVAVPLAWLLGLHLGWGLIGVWIAFTCDEWVRGLAMYARWKSRVWEKHAHAVRAHVAA